MAYDWFNDHNLLRCTSVSIQRVLIHLSNKYTSQKNKGNFISSGAEQLIYISRKSGGGADDRVRTGDLRFTRTLLFQLSYVGRYLTVGPVGGLEPTTYCLQDSCATRCATPAYCPFYKNILYHRTLEKYI